MNCKPGDLAVIIRSSRAENIGAIVQVGHFLPEGWRGVIDGVSYRISGPGFEITSTGRDLVTHLAGSLVRTKAHRASWLRPLRDGEGTDEMIRIAGLPQNLKETA